MNIEIGIIGTGYVGLVTGACFAEKGHKVICVDNDEKKVATLKKGISPIYEPGLEDLINKNMKNGNLSFTTDLGNTVKNSEILFIAVGTPSCADGSVDLNRVYGVAKEIAISMNNYAIIVNKSTVPVGTAEKVKELVSQNTHHKFDVVSNPEFLREGTAVNDFMNPDRIVIGADTDESANLMKTLYAPFVHPHNRLFLTNAKSAEIVKYASNLFLATKISFIGEIANLCEKVGANVEDVSNAVGADKRIGTAFLKAGIGYGGSCLPKDVKGIIATGKQFGLEFKVAEAVDNVNKEQRTLFVSKLKEYFNNNIAGKKIAVWGLSFKPETDDIREAPAIDIINSLTQEQANVSVYDPKAMNNAKKVLDSHKVFFADSALEALDDCDALVIATEWEEFKNQDLTEVKNKLKKPIIFDGRNIYNPKTMKELGFEYRSIGR